MRAHQTHAQCWLAALWATIAVGAACAPAPPPPQPGATTTPVPSVVIGRADAGFTTESEWIVWLMAREAARLSQLADPQPTTPVLRVATQQSPGGAVFVVSDGAREIAMVTPATHIWHVETVRPLLQALAPALSPVTPVKAAGTAATPTVLLDRLADARLDTILSENRRVSLALRRSPRTAALHEQAALLLGVMALRDGAGAWTDVRHVASRMAVHLAAADLLRGDAPMDAAGEVATGVLLALAGRERDARAIAAHLGETSRSASEKVWSRVMDLRATTDWRLLASPANARPIERLEHVRAIRLRLGTHRVLPWIGAEDGADRPEWSRIALHEAFNVDAGNRFATAALALEVAELQATRREYGAPKAEALDGLFDPIESAEVREYRVLDWPLWRDSAARHLAARIESLRRHLLNQGRTADLASTIDEVTDHLKGLPTMATARALAQRDAPSLVSDITEAARSVANAPEQVPPALWNQLADVAAAQKVPWPTADDWFRPWMPAGTVMAPGERSVRLGRRTGPSGDELAQYHEPAPTEWWVSYTLAWRLAGSKGLSMTSAWSVLGPATEYDLGALRYLFDHVPGTPEEYERVARTMCDVDVDYCNRLGAQLLVDGREADAARVYGEWFEKARDRVGASNGVSWLVHYRLDGGDADRARAIAERASEVGSAGGMTALADVLDRTGHAAKALALYERAARRYTELEGLPGTFHLRRWRATGDALAKQRGLDLVKTQFPAGLEAVTVDRLSAAPDDGIVFKTFGARPARVGLQQSDVLVAIDGYRVRSTGQYSVLMRSSWSPDVEFIVWREGQYLPVKGRVPQRYLGVILADKGAASRRSARTAR